MIVVCDSTVLIGLAKIGKLDLLKELFSRICIPQEVFHEVVEKGVGKPGAEALQGANWIEAIPIKDRTQVSLLMLSLDKGEAEVLALAKEMQADLILADEEKARRSAALAGFEVMGLLGLFLLAKNLGLVDAVKPLIEALRREKFRVSDRVVLEALKKAGE